MSDSMYLSQVALLGGVLLVVLRRSSFVLRAQVIVWMIGVSIIVLRFGVTEQLNFYSNDQRYYVPIVREIALLNLPLDIDWWLTYSKVPYTFPAAVLAAIGIAPSLALKVISLMCLLLVTRIVLSFVPPPTLRSTVTTVFLTACGGIGMLYSVLALRETMMMLFVTYFFVAKSPASRLISIVLLVLLRPHLAAALVVATLIVYLWESLRSKRRESTLSIATLTIFSVLMGSVVFSAGLWWQTGGQGLFLPQWGISLFTRITSNFVGLQFLTVDRETVEFSLTSLLLLRVFLSETILIPLFFVATLLLRPNKATTHGRLALVALSLYIGLATNTDFNSFRQNIPFMAVMGMVIITTWTPVKQQIPEIPSRADSIT